jgi:nucleoside-diphosphate-sugar epimerase
MKKVLLTGARGFIGRHCLPFLKADGYEIHAVSSRETWVANSEAYCHIADLLDPKQVEGLLKSVKPTHLLHLAWYAVPGKYWNASENLQWVRASLDLLQSFSAFGGQRVVIGGTCAEYDWTDGLCSERKTKLMPATLYGTCKHALRLMAEAYEREVKLSAAWGRIFLLYGPREYPERLVASVIRSLLKNEPARCSAGNQQRDFLYVEDAASALVALLNSDVRGPVNIASGQAMPVKEVVHRIAEILNRPELVELGAIPTSADDPPLIVADVERLQNEVGWKPRFDLNQGLEATIEWWKQSRFEK